MNLGFMFVCLFSMALHLVTTLQTFQAEAEREEGQLEFLESFQDVFLSESEGEDEEGAPQEVPFEVYSDSESATCFDGNGEGSETVMCFDANEEGDGEAEAYACEVPFACYGSHQ
jgi:hypothetical protein